MFSLGDCDLHQDIAFITASTILFIEDFKIHNLNLVFILILSYIILPFLIL